jgi:hypothetical protein
MKEYDGDDLGPWSEFGTAAGIAATDAAKALSATQELGTAPASGGAGGSDDGSHSGFGDAPDLDGLPPVTGLGDAPQAGVEQLGVGLGVGLGGVAREAAEKVREVTPPAGYHDQVDADGDGHLDRATYRGDGHGGVEILVDLNGDGRPDFIGHDTDLDNRVDYADYDKDHDGFFEKRMYDDNNDGILDRTVWTHDS